MGRDTETGSEVFEEDNSDLKSISHNFSSLSGSVSNICWVNIKVRQHPHCHHDHHNVFTRERTPMIILPMIRRK